MKQNKLTTALITTVICLIVVITAFIFLLSTRVRRNVTIELGQEVSEEDFRRYSWDKGLFIWLDQPDITSVGEKKGRIQVFPITYHVTLTIKDKKHNPSPTASAKEETPIPTLTPTLAPTEPPVVRDTVAPKVTVQNVFLYAEDFYENGILAEQFILEIVDDTECKIKMLTPLENIKTGQNVCRLLITDAEENFTEVEAELCIINAKKHATFELGDDIPVAEIFLYEPGSEISYVTDMTSINRMVEGSYEIILKVDGTETVSVLNIKDTTAPVLVLHSAETWLNKPMVVSAFVDNTASYDNSDEFEIAYVMEPDWSVEGEQIVKISAADSYGNSTIQEVTLHIKKDTKAPVVTATDIDVKVGGTVSYKKAVSYYDDVDSKEEMKLSIARSGVNLKEVGTYEVTYTVTDCSGNSTSVIGKVNVLKEAPLWDDEEVIHEKARGILDTIIREGMTDREKAYEIYRWIKSNVGYISHSEKGNYTRGAYEGLFKFQGDCFVYAATAKELLTLAEIPNIDIVKSTTNPSHYWNLVYIEDGWYHFDTTPRKDKSEFFLLTDAELEAYSSKHKNTHIFDRSLYPEIK